MGNYEVSVLRYKKVLKLYFRSSRFACSYISAHQEDNNLVADRSLSLVPGLEKTYVLIVFLLANPDTCQFLFFRPTMCGIGQNHGDKKVVVGILSNT